MKRAHSAPVGVLALQGDFAAHARVVESLGETAVEIRRAEQLADVRGLILPGGESTTLLKLMARGGFDEALPAFHRDGGALFGTCAGMILLARRVTGPDQPGLGLIDIDVERNAYGRQVDSFETVAEWTSPALNGASEVVGQEMSLTDTDGAVQGGASDGSSRNGKSRLPLVFIRAPRLSRLGDGVEPLARCRGDVVLARQGRVMVASFHPEITGDERVHRTFLSMVRSASPTARPALATSARH